MTYQELKGLLLPLAWAGSWNNQPARVAEYIKSLEKRIQDLENRLNVTDHALCQRTVQLERDSHKPET